MNKVTWVTDKELAAVSGGVGVITPVQLAAQTASMSKAQVLQQAGVSSLAQANTAPQQVLSLLA
ncbi:MAG: flagellin [Legionella sp.]|uniref:flagellin n=1 Tax=Legionella sp. TaxID=459 RepID=UPI00283B580C|nr:flagellin [Legionella sp.]